MTEKKSHDSLDTILVKLKDFGRYQIYVFSLVCVAVVFHSAVHVAYVFTALDITYRCEIPECDSASSKYDDRWVSNAVPFTDGAPKKCSMYQPYENDTLPTNCSAEDFNRDIIERCSSFVFKTDEKTIVQEYGLYCNENLWKLTMVGTINTVGQFFGLFVSGILSDKYGRRAVLVWGMVLCATCGIIKGFMPTYEWFLAFEFLDATFGAGTYICGFVLGVELVGPKNRVLTGTFVSSCYAIGEILTAGCAFLLQSWRHLIFVLYSPIFLLLSYLWLIPESIRWHISKGRLEEAKQTLRKVAKFNNREITDKDLENLHTLVQGNQEDSEKEKNSFREVFRSVTLMIRFGNCCFCWITCAFLFYGLSLNSVALAGNSYLDFTLTALVEIPAYVACNFTMEKFGRKRSLAASYLITAAACVGFVFIPTESHWWSLAVYLLGKFGATAAFTSLYVLTSEMFPTNMRHSFMGTCSTFGRIGSMVSPQTPLLAQIWNPLPVVCFGLMACLAAAISFIFPETLNRKLPDTIEEAENIGREKKTSAVEEVVQTKF